MLSNDRLKNLHKNLDALNLPDDELLEQLFPEKLKIFSQLRAVEAELNNTLHLKFNTFREDLIKSMNS